MHIKSLIQIHTTRFSIFDLNGLLGKSSNSEMDFCQGDTQADDPFYRVEGKVHIGFNQNFKVIFKFVFRRKDDLERKVLRSQLSLKGKIRMARVFGAYS